MMPTATPIRRSLTKAIIRSGLKHEEIAQLSGVPLLTVRRIAFGIGNPMLSTADKLALALELELVSRDAPTTDPTSDNPA